MCACVYTCVYILIISGGSSFCLPVFGVSCMCVCLPRESFLVNPCQKFIFCLSLLSIFDLPFCFFGFLLKFQRRSRSLVYLLDLDKIDFTGVSHLSS